MTPTQIIKFLRSIKENFNLTHSQKVALIHAIAWAMIKEEI